MSYEVFSADDLIALYGDQAYHKGLRMAVEALLGGDRESSKKLAEANILLIQRGYHKHPEKESEAEEDVSGTEKEG